eukprot:m.5793 g.5793  ORF g.5793 m.5793 type:complete len:143 (+) comp14119_c0_seq2:16-444(+)
MSRFWFISSSLQRSVPFRRQLFQRFLSCERPWYDVEYSDFRKRMDSEDLLLLDVRERHEYQAGMIRNAINIPLGDVERALQMSEVTFQNVYGVSKPDKNDSNIVFHCLGGVRSRKALNIAHSLGYGQAQHYIGGYQEWTEKN